MHSYLVFDICAEEPHREAILAWLDAWGVASVEETERGWKAYPGRQLAGEELDARLRALQADLPFTYTRHELPHTNWNALWEAHFQPIRVGHFCGVRADFHYPFLDVQHEIVITPRMTFGTGHHETTYMMLEEMANLDVRDAKVLDFGCGTGILSILAARMGATMIDAVDIEEEAFHNTLHNAQINDVDSIQAIHGNLDAILDRGYRVILANINRNVLLEALPALYDKLGRPGFLLISGILWTDQAELVGAARQLGFRVRSVRQRGEWACLNLHLPG